MKPTVTIDLERYNDLLRTEKESNKIKREYKEKCIKLLKEKPTVVFKPNCYWEDFGDVYINEEALERFKEEIKIHFMIRQINTLEHRQTWYQQFFKQFKKQ